MQFELDPASCREEGLSEPLREPGSSGGKTRPDYSGYQD